MIFHISVHKFMLALKITNKGKETVVGVKDGLLTVLIHDEFNRCIMHASSVEINRKEKNIWFDAEEMDEEMEIEVVDTEYLSIPMKIKSKVSSGKVQSEFERYCMLEEYLKEKGLI